MVGLFLILLPTAEIVMASSNAVTGHVSVSGLCVTDTLTEGTARTRVQRPDVVRGTVTTL